MMHHLAAALEAAESGGLAPLSASLLGEHEWGDASILGTRGVCLRRLAQLEEECSEQVVARGGGADEAWSRSYKAFRLYQQAVSCCDETAPSSEADASVANSFDGWLGGTTPRLWGGEEEGTMRNTKRVPTNEAKVGSGGQWWATSRHPGSCSHVPRRGHVPLQLVNFMCSCT